MMILNIVAYAQTQDTSKVNVTSSKKIVEINETYDRTEVKLLNDKINILDNSANDTTLIRIGRRNIEIVEDGGHTNVTVHRTEKKDDDEDKHFNGHWAGFELGVNGFYDENYSLYPNPDDEFMELDQPRSLEVNINFMEYNIVLQEERIGLVTGMGWSMNNYKFDNNLTIDKNEAGIVASVPLTEEVEKTKLTVSYLTVPLMLEFQIPVNKSSNHIFIAGGVVGGVNLGSHTKVKQDNSKEKDRGSFNINPFKCSAQLRAGLKNISLYASYGLTPLFKDDKGPELYPFSIGISLINF